MNWTDKTQQLTQQLVSELQLPEAFSMTIENIYKPLAQTILESASSSPLVVSINGAQGTGKSTLAQFLKAMLESESGCCVAELSIDDFYATKDERDLLADKIHPLLTTRGVPGTHDIEILQATLEKLKSKAPCTYPRFNKATDDRQQTDKWAIQSDPVDIILFEGWCNNSPFQTESELENPINELEETEDAEGIWRQYANEQLKQYHKYIFSLTDMSIMLQAPSFEHIYEWRSLQEEKLRQQASSDTSGIMNQQQLKRFIQHYERISRHTLKHLPDKADIVLPVNTDHTIETIIKRQ